MSTEQKGRLDRGDGVELAWAALPGGSGGPTVVFLGGFRSDMEGSKALALRDACAARGLPFLRLDYSGHGASGGVFEEGSIGIWAEDAARVIEARAPGPLVLVGSSMGGWIALLLARRWGARVRALLGIAAAPDFTSRLMEPGLDEAQRAELARVGVIYQPSPYGPPVPITAKLLRDGRSQSIFGEPLPFAGPVRLLQGMRDVEVPWQTATDLATHLGAEDLRIVLVKDGDHRLSRPQDLALLEATLLELLGTVNGGEAGAVAGIAPA
ncbi:alpha/beta hydrolase [Roseomonas marmotae]|uniref:Palmitoyl-protein thioesterase ABHD10, mitochondrial n=1 Tax=Roseomonas marmotae TaxID=2768161 RepID=A0ABS3K6W5_9PROT|nr:alpha/beta hydrolase [Roseomonas marmotae]MBO1073196.1 alpha/beta hydrolase [Roseomonas marmotae]QTI79173.1 alpha/beta hydrolase [Roseomonas marmotae]